MKDLTVWASLAIAALIVAAMAKPKKTLIGGFMTKGKKGKFTLNLTPVKRKK